LWSESEYKAIKKNVLALMVADDPSIDPSSMESQSIDSLLEKYKVGTDGEKPWQKKTHLPPKPSNWCPIYNRPFKSTMKLTVIGLKHEQIAKDSGKKQKLHKLLPEQLLFDPNYVQVLMLIKASRGIS
jgi:hypothetical protein